METEIEKLRRENTALKNDATILIEQIDMLNDRSIEIRKQNDILTEKLSILEKNNAELEKVQQEKNKLFSVIIHDIKSPTNIIKGLVELLASFGSLTADQQEIVQALVKSTKQVISLSNEVSKVLALEGSKINMFYELANPKDIIADVVRRNHTNAQNKAQNISVDLQEDMPKFKVDVGKIAEVLDNLVSNSIKYTQFGGKIVVNAQQNEDNIEISVTDNGLGMSDEDLKRVFQRGAKLSASPTGDEISTGIGLWIVKKIVDAHKGRVWIKSTLGRGTTFVVSLPITAPAADLEYI